MMLQKQIPVDADTTVLIQNLILAQLNLPFDSKTEDSEHQKQFIRICLSLLKSLGLANGHFIVELMAQYVTADMEIRWVYT